MKKYFLMLFSVLLICFIFTGCGKDLEKTKVEITVKNYGVITVELDPTYAPKTVENFLELVNKGFYNGLTFHRIVEGFMIQGGDPFGDSTGGSGVNIVGEFAANGYKNNLSHKKGVISMARGDDYNSASSQFFIVQEDSPHLDGYYAAFGIVIDGMDVVDEIAKSVEVGENGKVERKKQPVIESIKVIEKTEEK